MRVKRLPRCLGVLGALLLLGGCCARPWDSYPMSVRPDRACRTGSVEGYDVYIWSCLDGKRVVVFAYSAEMTCREPEQQTAACGALTPIEQQLGARVAEGCTPVPESLRWP